MPFHKSLARAFTRVGKGIGRGLARRPEFKATGLTLEPRREPFTQDLGGLQPQQFPGIRPEVGTRTLTAQGAPAGVSALADFLTGFGGGPQAALAQQQQRTLAIRQRLQSRVQSGQADLEAVMAQIAISPKIVDTKDGLAAIDVINQTVTPFDMTNTKGMEQFMSWLNTKAGFSKEEIGEVIIAGAGLSGRAKLAAMQKRAEDKISKRAAIKAQRERAAIQAARRPRTSFENLARSAEKMKAELGLDPTLTGSEMREVNEDFANLNRNGFMAFTNMQGEIIGFIKPGTGETAPPPFPGARKTGVSSAELSKSADRAALLAKAIMFEALLKEGGEEGIFGSVGPLVGPLTRIKVGLIGGSNVQIDLVRESGKMLADLTKAVSGATVSEPEARRLRPLVPNINMPLSTALRTADLFIAEMKAIIAEREKAGLAIPRSLAVDPNKDAGTVPSGQE